ncbi:F151B protein, partial [Pachycephala philippinensis]|nr:F151B protein [Pachycephala philippinensis]
PILAHPPDTDSDITLQEWLAQMVSTNKGIKLDFKSLGAVGPSLELLEQLEQPLERPVWLNGDVLPGPRGSRAPLDAHAFLDTVTLLCPEATLSLGWTTGCHRGQGKGRAWLLGLQPVSPGLEMGGGGNLSCAEANPETETGQEYSLTVWTGKEDMYSVEDLLFIRENFDKSRVYYDIFEPQNSEFKKAIGI